MSPMDYMMIEDALRGVERVLQEVRDDQSLLAFNTTIELINVRAMLRAALVGNEPEPA